MKVFEFFSGPDSSKKETPPSATAEDFSDNPDLYGMLRRLPVELQNVHASRISDFKMDDEEAITYIAGVLEKRGEAVRESFVSDEQFDAYFHAHEKEIWNRLETDVFNDPEKLLGVGQTARIKRFDLENDKGESVPVAVKYLVSPTEKTLSASGEHDLIREVERVRAIEISARKHQNDIPHIGVPHPFFHYQNKKLQCYGMQLIDGINLEQGAEGPTGINNYSEEVRDELKAKLTGIDRDSLMQEIRTFFGDAHEICIHGDMKPANMMVDRNGRFYVIDFGQSTLMTDIDDKSRDALDVKKEDDITFAQNAVRSFLDALGA